MKKHNGSSGFHWHNGGTTHPYLKTHFPIFVTLWISSSIHHITFKVDYKVSSSGVQHRAPGRGSQAIEGKKNYGTK